MAGIVTQKDNVRLFIWDEGSVVAAANKVGNITQLGDVGGETEDIDVTTIESLAREYENGFDDNGTVDITQNLTSNEYTTMAVRKDSGQDIRWGISAFNKKGTQVLGLQGKGIIKSAKLTGISVSGLLQCTSAIRINGVIDNDFVDPIGFVVGKQIENIAVTVMGGATAEVNIGAKLQLVATITPSDATNKVLTWTSSAEATATVTSTGELTGVAAGTVTITAAATDGSGVTGTLEVEVKNA